MSNAKPDVRYQNMPQSVVLISTGHLTARTAQFLRDHDAADWPSPGGHFGDMGWFFWVDEGAGDNVPHLPHDLLSAFDYAVAQGASFVIYQDVSPVVPQLPTYSKSGVFEADVFLNRTKKTIDDLDDDAAVAAQESLSLDIGFIATAAHIAARMQAVIDDIAAHASNGQISALPYHRLQQLSDLATIYHFHARRKAKGFDSGASVTEGLAARIDLILVDRDLAGLARHGRTREVLENVQYRLRLSVKISAG
ncbi:hypothetical protein [Rhizobium leguminosarum]|uniref:DUF5983 family protein n=1 Tax=Rhizobium leguminosarum TaxID=384 RepID=UPI00102FE6C3|nr:hypothetical protein [Rhizobium leguminosarum]TAV74724.1 hypothetical protein ELI28_14850 [Rhizobium leguminosarum]TAV79323.1 hypothetical protein ELI27_14840 [Rhizobium leguminosarum]